MSPDHAKAVAEALTTLWLDEIRATLKVLAAVPDANRDYRPAPKSRSAWELATHMATSDLWFINSIEQGSFQFDREAASRAEAQFGSIADVVAFYESTIPARLKGLAEMDGEALAESIDFFGMMNRSRAAWIGFSTNHSIHHRGQLSAYLRAMGSKVPDIYGPSGDAEPMEAKA